jgi:hypothetical protein
VATATATGLLRRMMPGSPMKAKPAVRPAITKRVARRPAIAGPALAMTALRWRRR